MTKAALNIWSIQEQSEDWYPRLARIRYQLNCNKPRTTKFTPYELLYSKKPPALGRPASAQRSVTGLCAERPSTHCTGPLTLPPFSPHWLPVRNCKHHYQSNSHHFPSSQLPLVSSQLPDTEPTVYQQCVLNCCAGQPSALNLYMADQLNVRCYLMRLGGEGGGRCAISAFYNCISPMRFINLSSADRRKAYDNIREQLRALWMKLSTEKDKTTVAKQQRLQQMIFELGNSGSSLGDAVRRATSPAARHS